MTIEIELKYRVTGFASVEHFLAEHSVEFSNPIHQRDDYLQHPQRDFGETDEALRVRSTFGRSCVTYKGPKLDTQSKTREEIEFGIGNDKEVDAALSLFRALGFDPSVTVTKHRQKAKLRWHDLTVTVALDEVDQPR